MERTREFGVVLLTNSLWKESNDSSFCSWNFNSGFDFSVVATGNIQNGGLEKSFQLYPKQEAKLTTELQFSNSILSVDIPTEVKNTYQIRVKLCMQKNDHVSALDGDPKMVLILEFGHR